MLIYQRVGEINEHEDLPLEGFDELGLQNHPMNKESMVSRDMRWYPVFR